MTVGFAGPATSPVQLPGVIAVAPLIESFGGGVPWAAATPGVSTRNAPTKPVASATRLISSNSGEILPTPGK